MRLNIQLFANEISTTSTSVTLGDTIRVNITTDASYKVTLIFYVYDSKTEPKAIDTSSYITGAYYDYTVKENVYDVLKETIGILMISGMVESYQGDFIGFTNDINLTLTVPKLPTKLVNVNKTVSALAIGGKSTAKDDEELFENYMASKFYKDVEVNGKTQIKNNGKTINITNDVNGNSSFTTDANQFYFNKRINCDNVINQKYKKVFFRDAGYVENPTYYLLAKLPASTAATGDILNIKGYIGGYASNEQAVIDVQIGNRGGLRCNGTWIGVDSYAFRYSRLRLYTNNGETYVYLMTNGWCGNVRLEISGMWNEIYDTFPSTTTPVGTLALDVNEKVLNNASDVYSTDEIVIGKWINDKPIYRKVLDLGSVTTIIGTSHFNHNISNFDVLVNFNIKAYFQSQNAWYNWWEAYKAMTVDATQIHIHTSAATTFSQVYITLEYTKTTD